MREPHQLVHHGVAGTLRQLVHVGGRQAGGGDRGKHCGSISKPVLVAFMRGDVFSRAAEKGCREKG